MSWPDVVIKDVCELAVDCVNKTAPFVEYETPYKMLRTTNVRGGFVDVQNVRYVTEETFEKWTRRVIPKRGDVILTREAPLGDIGRLTSDDKVFLGQRLFLYRADPAKLDPVFLAYVLQSPLVQGRIKSTGFGATVQHAKIGDCENLKIPFPPLDKQIKIGEILSAYDDLIENNQRRIQLLEESTRLLYQEWFVHFRFPGYEKHGIQIGLPQGWSKKSLKDLLILNYGKALKADTRIPGAIPVYGSSGNVGSHNSALVKGPGIVIGRKGNIGSIFWVNTDFYPIDTVYYISNEQSDLYIYHALKNIEFINTDVAVPGLNRNLAYSREIIIPSEEVYKLFVGQVSPIQEQIEHLQTYNQKISQTRDLLLPRLMNREIPV